MNKPSFRPPWYVYVSVILILALFLNKSVKGLISIVQTKIQAAKRDGSTVQTPAGSAVNLQDVAHIVYSSLTNFGFLISGGLFTDGGKVVNELIRLTPANIKSLATTYAQIYNRNLYNDLIDGLTDSEYNQIKSLL